MPGYMIRVELHKATADDYETLHELMEEAGLKRTIKSDDGTLYQLPTAEYYGWVEEDKYSAETVRDYVEEKTESITLRKWIFVSKTDDVAWKGKPVKK